MTNKEGSATDIIALLQIISDLEDAKRETTTILLAMKVFLPYQEIYIVLITKLK